MGDHKITNPGELARTVADIKPGESAKLAILRDGRGTPVTVTIASLPDDRAAAQQDTVPNGEQIGVALAPLSPEVRGQLNLADGVKGAVIADIQPNSPAQLGRVARRRRAGRRGHQGGRDAGGCRQGYPLGPPRWQGDLASGLAGGAVAFRGDPRQGVDEWLSDRPIDRPGCPCEIPGAVSHARCPGGFGLDIMEQHRIAGDGIGAAIKADGAELCVLQDRDGRDLLWDAGPLWPSHAPVLFPIVGRVAGDQVQINGHAYPLSRHGFARRRRFAWVERSTTRCSLELRDDEATRAVYPFGFQLELTYAIENGGLRVDYALRNPGTELLPASLGAHPAFRWPLREGAQTEYRLEFADDEAAPIHRLAGGLLDPARCLEPDP